MQARLALESKADLMQTLMLAMAEAEFFSSAPVIVSVAEALQREAAAGLAPPPEVLVHGFTLTGVAMLVSERCRLPMAGFILQPASIPSADPAWECVSAIDSVGVGNAVAFLDKLGLAAKASKAARQHETLARMKRIAAAQPV